MRRMGFLIAGTLLAASMLATPARADDTSDFKGPGWYLLANALVWLIDSGPYASEGDCEAAERANAAAQGDPNGYYCAHLNAESDLGRINGGG